MEGLQRFETGRHSLAREVTYDSIIIDHRDSNARRFGPILPRVNILNKMQMFLQATQLKPRHWAGCSEEERTMKMIDMAGNKDKIVELWTIYFENRDVRNPKGQTKKDMVTDLQELAFEMRRRNGENLINQSTFSLTDEGYGVPVINREPNR